MNCNKCNKKATLHSLTYYDSWDYGFCPVCFTRLSNKQILIKIDEMSAYLTPIGFLAYFED